MNFVDPQANRFLAPDDLKLHPNQISGLKGSVPKFARAHVLVFIETGLAMRNFCPPVRRNFKMSVSNRKNRALMTNPISARPTSAHCEP